MRLIPAVAGRDNNFNLLRFVAATAVLLSHCVALWSGSSDNEPLRKLLGMTPGTIAVDVFFITSGFLVTGSICASRSLVDFAVARGLRIYPGLVVMTMLSVVVLGVYFSTLPAAEFVAHPQTQTFLLKNFSVFWGTTGALPGVFETLPMKRLVNASLWTLPFEVHMYAGLALIWALVAYFPVLRNRGSSNLLLATGLLAAAAFVLLLRAYFTAGVVDHRFRLIFLFFSGSVCFLMRARLRRDFRIMAFLMLCLCLSAVNVKIFFVVYHLVISYCVLWLAYVPAGALRKFNRIGDYSYGLYIYAFPLQQTLLALIPNISLSIYMGASVALTLVFAVASWYFIEKPALALSRVFRQRKKNSARASVA